MAHGVCFSGRTVRVVRLILAILLAVCGCSQMASAQTTVTLSTPGTQINVDTTIQGGAYALTDFGYSDTLASKKSSDSYTRRILLKFDTQDFVPAGASIQSAKLYLVLRSAESSEQRPLTAYYVTKSFTAHAKLTSAWSTGGADLGGSFGTTYVGDSVGSAYAFDVTQLVQKAVNGDFGSRYTRLALVDTGGATSGTYRAFYSTRAGDASVRPRLVITYGGTSTSTDSAPPPPPPPPSSGATLRVMQWNIHKTKNSNGVCDPDFTANTIVAQNPQVVSLNEVNFYSGTCAWDFDMSQRLESLLEQKTGAQWYRQSVNAGGVGNVLLSRIQPIASNSRLLDYNRGVAQMTIVVNGRNINLFSTHVDYDNASWRTIQTNEVVGWVPNFSNPRIIMGDFNTWPDTSDYYIMATPYQDAWVSAVNAGTASSYTGTGSTHGTSRFDYVYHSRNSVVSLSSVTVPDTAVNGLYPSDHDPVIAVYQVN
jgi:endonuclease/exonuclease/phosphatase family metal-dependent hydrolase